MPPDLRCGLPNGLGTPTLIDVDRNGTADIAYAGDRQGNLFRFNVSNSNPSAVERDQVVPGDVHERNDANQPITTQPYVFKHPTLPGLHRDRRHRQLRDRDSTACRPNPVGLRHLGSRRDRAGHRRQQYEGDAAGAQTVTNIVDGTADGFQKLRYVSANPVDYVPDAGVVPGVYGWYFDFTMSGRC